jgi:hypothetical protein
MAMMNGGPGKRTVKKEVSKSPQSGITYKTKEVTKPSGARKLKISSNETTYMGMPSKSKQVRVYPGEEGGKLKGVSKQIVDTKPGKPGGKVVAKRGFEIKADGKSRDLDKIRGKAAHEKALQKYRSEYKYK